MIVDDRQERWRCQFCEYWQDKREYDWEDTIPGECHLLPPTVVCDTSDISISKWPETMPWDWCGQWKQHYRLAKFAE